MREAGPSSAEPPTANGARGAAWGVAVVLFLSTVLNYIDRQVLSLNAEYVMGEFDLTREQFGWIVAAFRYAYAGFQTAGGWLVDFAGAWIVYPAAVGLWSIAGLMTAWAASPRQLAAWRFLLGAGEAFNWPCALQVTHRLLEPRDRALANGIFNSGSAFGALIAPLLVTFLTLRFGWRASFLVTGGLGLLWILLWSRTALGSRSRLRGHRSGRPPLASILAGILRRRAFWLLSVSAVIDWIPLYLKTERRATAGLLGGIGNLSYGLVSPYIGRLADLGRSRSVFLLAGLLPWLAFLAIRRTLVAGRAKRAKGGT